MLEGLGGSTLCGNKTHANTHFVEAFVVQVVHRLTVDELLLSATFEATAAVPGTRERVAAVCYLHVGEGGSQEINFILKATLISLC